MNTELYDLQNQVDEIEKKISALSLALAEIENAEPVQPNDSQQDDEEQEQPAVETWTTVYDKDSEDASLNLGYTSGLLGNTTLENFPDLSNFSKLRVWAYGASNDGFYDFELDDKVNTRTHSIIFANSSGTTLYVYGFITKAVDNTFVISKTNVFIRLYFVNGKTSTVTDYSQNSLYYIRKIDAM